MKSAQQIKYHPISIKIKDLITIIFLQTLDDHLCAEIKERMKPKKFDTMPQSNYSQQQQQRPFTRVNSRPALRDLL